MSANRSRGNRLRYIRILSGWFVGAATHTASVHPI
jgi:hypothetical protein